MKLRHTVVCFTAVLAALAVTQARANTLTAVPMQGPMVHVGIQYATHDGAHLHVHIEPSIPQLIPLSLSHPADAFVASAPWFADLDPSAGGAAFNRQYGFVLDGLSDPLPSGYGIRIRQLSASTGLEAFSYRTSPETWAPMFGTDGSSDTLVWNLGMFHPAYTAPAGVGTYFATYEAFVVDENGQSTGVSEQFQLEWSAIPEPTSAVLTLLGVGWVASVLRRRPTRG